MRRTLVLAFLCAAGAAAPARAARVVTWETASRFVDPEKVQFNAPPPGEPARPPGLRVNVFLPDGYDAPAKATRRYPVLYLLHGHGDSFDSWTSAQRGNLLAIAKGFGGLVVMPEGARGWYANWWSGGRRGEPAWERYHLEELVPLVERRLRVRAGRRWHAIAGLSMGGEGAAYYATQRPGYFGAVASFSPPLSIQRPEWPLGFDTQGEKHTEVFGDPSKQRFYWTGHNPTALVRNLEHTRVFVSVGDGVPAADPGEVRNTFGQIAEAELRQHATDFVDAARRAGVEVTYTPHQGIHDWPYWRADLAAAMAWGPFKPVTAKPRSWTFQTAAQRGDAWGLRFEFAKPPETLETFKLEGRRLSATGSGTVTIRRAGAAPFTERLPFERNLTPVRKVRHDRARSRG